MALTITIGGIDRTSAVRFESLSIVNTIAANSDVADIRISLSAASASTWRPMAGNEVIITNGATREFAGMMIEITEFGEPITRLRYACQCRDYLHLFNKKLINAFSTALAGVSPATVDQVVIGVVAQSTDGFSSTGVAAGPVTPAERYDYVPPGDIIRRLADQASYAWWIDYNKVVNFVPAASLFAPVTSINLDTDITNYGAMDIKESVAQLKNDVFVKGWKQRTTVTYSASYTGDGVSKFHLFGYEPSALSDISATINGSPLAVLTDGVDGSAGDGTGTSGNIFTCFDNLGFRQNYAPTSTETLVIASNYMTPGITRAVDTNAQSTAATREGGDGVHQYAYDSPALTATDGSVTLADAKAHTIISRDAYPRITGKFVSYTQGWRAGQSLTITSNKRLPPTGINKTVYVQQVTKTLVNHLSGGTPTIKYEIEFADSFLPQ